MVRRGEIGRSGEEGGEEERGRVRTKIEVPSVFYNKPSHSSPNEYLILE
jgi:hypothetical protein